MKPPIYARDLKPSIANDTFMGKGFEKLVRKAEKMGEEVEVGVFFDKAFIDTGTKKLYQVKKLV